MTQEAMTVDPSFELATRNHMSVRLAKNKQEVRAAQSLRYHIFYEEMSASPLPKMEETKRDYDRFDDICDHLLVVAPQTTPASGMNLKDGTTVIGCYRLLRQEVANKHGGFYTETEFAIQPMIKKVGSDIRFLELGRSCVLPAYRNRQTIDLLWHGIGAYIKHHHIDAMMGCASFASVEPDKLALPLSYLYHYHLAPKPWRIHALKKNYVPMNQIDKKDIDARAAFRALPPVIRGYVRAGGFVGDGAVVDKQFGTTDVFIIFPVSNVKESYTSKFVS